MIMVTFITPIIGKATINIPKTVETIFVHINEIFY